MNKSELKAKVEATGSHFFERSSMKFFGDTMANYYVPKEPVTITTRQGDKQQCYELQRRRPVTQGLADSDYFDINTFERVHPRAILAT